MRNVGSVFLTAGIVMFLSLIFLRGVSPWYIVAALAAFACGTALILIARQRSRRGDAERSDASNLTLARTVVPIGMIVGAALILAQYLTAGGAASRRYGIPTIAACIVTALVGVAAFLIPRIGKRTRR